MSLDNKKNLPDKILVLPALPQSSNLQEENTIVIKHVVNLSQESSEVSNTDVLGHLQAGDLVVLSGGDRRITVIGTDNARLRFLNTITTKSVVTPSSLVTSKSDTGDMGSVVLGSKARESSPSTSKIEHTLTLLKVDLLTHDLKLVVLELFKSLFLAGI
jgi:hypothetical protein